MLYKCRSSFSHSVSRLSRLKSLRGLCALCRLDRIVLSGKQGQQVSVVVTTDQAGALVPP